MKRLFLLAGSLFVWFCVATVLALVAGIATLTARGTITPDKMMDVWAALYGTNEAAIRAKLEETERARNSSQPSLADLTALEVSESLDLNLRENALDKGLEALTAMQTSLKTDQDRFRTLKLSFDTRLKEMEDAQRAQLLQELQRTLEAIKPKLAKEQIIKMLGDNAIDQVVMILKTMPLDKRKKIIAEFKDAADADKLYEIFKKFLDGEPTAAQIEQMRSQLEQAKPQP